MVARAMFDAKPSTTPAAPGTNTCAKNTKPSHATRLPGGIRGGKPGKYAGHKQPGLHGSKSFGAFWGADEKQARSPPRGPQANNCSSSDGLINVAGHRPPPAPETHQNPASRKAAAGARRRSGKGEAAGGGGASAAIMEVDVVPAVKKGAVELTPIRGISRVWAG